MKTLIKIAAISVSLLIFSGCAGAYSNAYKVKTPKPLAHTVKVFEHKDTINKPVYFENQESIYQKPLQQVDKQLAETFYASAVYGKNKGYKYFVIVEEKINNLGGFPINNFENIKNLCNWEYNNAKRNYKPEQLCWDEHSKSLIGSYIGFEVRYFKKPIPGLFLYNIDEVIEETEKYL